MLREMLEKFFRILESFFHMLFARRNFSIVARYSLKFTRCSLLVVKSLVTPCKKLLVAKNHSLLVANFTRYSLKNLLVTRCRSCLLLKFTRYSLQNSLVTRCRSCSLQKLFRCKKSLVARCKIQSLLIA